MKYNDNGTYEDIFVKVCDTLPIGAIVEYYGATIPDGWADIGNNKIQKTSQAVTTDYQVNGIYTSSQSQAYSCNYINDLFNSRNEYSTSEVRIGTWIDGKPLYRKVLTVPPLANNGIVTVTYNSEYIVQRYEIYVENPTTDYKFSIPIPTNTYITCYCQNNNHRLQVVSSSDRTALTNNYAIIEYTKTTD